MASTYQVQISRRAARHVDSISEYISQDSPHAANQLVNEFFAAIGSLRHLPHRHQIDQTVGTPTRPIRTLVVFPYLVRYSINEPKRIVTVVSIRHGARRPGL